jgi:hypothetical protein
LYNRYFYRKQIIGIYRMRLPQAIITIRFIVIRNLVTKLKILITFLKLIKTKSFTQSKPESVLPGTSSIVPSFMYAAIRYRG